MMYQDDYFNATDPNDLNDDSNFDKMIEDSKRKDRGYNVIFRRAYKKSGKKYNKKIEVYSSGGTGAYIRDAETGEYYSSLVGSKDEDLFFKVKLATGECTSANGSSTLFYNSPQHYASHFECSVNSPHLLLWEDKRNSRLLELKYSQKTDYNTIEVR